MLGWIGSVLSGLVTTILLILAGLRIGWLKSRNTELAKENKAHDTRKKVEDANSKLGFDERRKLLRDKWAVRGVVRDKTDGR